MTEGTCSCSTTLNEIGKGLEHHLQKLTKIEKTLFIMDWVDLLMSIDFLHQETAEGDSNNPLPWRIDVSNNMNRPHYATTCSALRHPRQRTAASQPITAPDRFDVVCGRGQGVLGLPGNKTYRELVSMNKVRRYCLQLN